MPAHRQVYLFIIVVASPKMLVTFSGDNIFSSYFQVVYVSIKCSCCTNQVWVFACAFVYCLCRWFATYYLETDFRHYICSYYTVICLERCLCVCVFLFVWKMMEMFCLRVLKTMSNELHSLQGQCEMWILVLEKLSEHMNEWTVRANVCASISFIKINLSFAFIVYGIWVFTSNAFVAGK